MRIMNNHFFLLNIYKIKNNSKAVLILVPLKYILENT